ncbi:MAG: GDSL-type esterase/lipase family protein, partial [Limisphaerales bacterium]
MKCLLTGVLLLLTVAIAGADESKERPKQSEPAQDMSALFRMHYVNRTAAFKEQNLAWQHVVLLGDSITEGFDVSKYLPGRRVLNRGIGADIIGHQVKEGDPRGVLRRLDHSVFNCSATDVFLLIGINDLGDGRSVEVMEEGYRDILKRIKETTPTVRVHVQSVLPTRGNFARHNASVLQFNHRIEKLAREFGYNFIDLHTLMKDENGELKTEFTRDGLHLN